MTSNKRKARRIVNRSARGAGLKRAGFVLRDGKLIPVWKLKKKKGS